MNDNRGGLANILAVPANEIVISENYVSNMVFPVISNLGKVIKIPRFAGQQYMYSEIQEMADHGDKWKVTISGKFPAELMEEEDKITLRRGEWILIHQNNMGEVKLSGTREIPLYCTLKEDTGESEPEMNYISFTFSAIEREASWKCSLVDVENLENL